MRGILFHADHMVRSDFFCNDRICSVLQKDMFLKAHIFKRDGLELLSGRSVSWEAETVL